MKMIQIFICIYSKFKVILFVARNSMVSSHIVKKRIFELFLQENSSFSFLFLYCIIFIDI